MRQHVGQIDPVEVLHHEVGAAVLGRAEVGDVDDVRVPDARRGARLAPEPLDQVLLARVGRVQDLDRDALADLDVLAGVDGPHAALADLAQDAVAVLDDPPGEVVRPGAATPPDASATVDAESLTTGSSAGRRQTCVAGSTSSRWSAEGFVGAARHRAGSLALAEQALALALLALLADAPAVQAAQELRRRARRRRAARPG